MWRDRWLWGALLAGLLLRLLPMLVWPQVECVRDECIYRFLAQGIQNQGELGLTTKGWLAAPGYPWLLAGAKTYLGSYFSVKWIQIVISMTSIPVLYRIARLQFERPAVARWAAWLLALHPTIAWYPSTWWIETLYIGFLLPAVLGVLLARRGHWGWAAMAGACLGLCVLFRGVATPLPVVFTLALLWPDDGWASVDRWTEVAKQRWRAVLALAVAGAMFVLPYTMYASQKYGGLVISDATLGHVMYLGNNDFEPMTFDYGNGVLTQPLYFQEIKSGRRFCNRKTRKGEWKLKAAEASSCDMRNAFAWMRAHPGEFVGRIPVRLAQQLNPNSFLTRHVRWGFFPGIPWLLKELLCLWIVITTAVVVVGGTIGGVARGRGPFAVMAGGVMVLTMGAAAAMYGMTRFRLPLEPLWLVWLAALLGNPAATARSIRESLPRAIALIALLPALIWLMLWFLPTGFPMFWR